MTPVNHPLPETFQRVTGGGHSPPRDGWLVAGDAKIVGKLLSVIRGHEMNDASAVTAELGRRYPTAAWGAAVCGR